MRTYIATQVLLLAFFGPRTPGRKFVPRQDTRSSQQSANSIELANARAVVAGILEKSIKAGTGRTVEGYPYYTFAPVGTSNVETIRGLGKNGITALAECVWSDKETRARGLALRILGLVGGPQIVSPLKEIIEHHAVPAIREQALWDITQAPWSLSSGIIETAAEKDPDPEVRRTAKKILVRYSPKL